MTHRKAGTVGLIVLLLCATSANFASAQTRSPQPSSEIEALKKQLAALSEQVKQLSETLDVLSNSHYEVYGKILTLEDADSSVFMDPGTPKEYQRIKSSAGFLLVSLEEVSPYLDGYRVVLNVGNPSLATYDGFTVNATYGPRAEPGPFNIEKFRKRQAQIKKKEISFLQQLQPGVWNKVDFILSPATATQVGFIQVSIDTSTLVLRKAP